MSVKTHAVGRLAIPGVTKHFAAGSVVNVQSTNVVVEGVKVGADDTVDGVPVNAVDRLVADVVKSNMVGVVGRGVQRVTEVLADVAGSVPAGSTRPVILAVVRVVVGDVVRFDVTDGVVNPGEGVASNVTGVGVAGQRGVN